MIPAGESGPPAAGDAAFLEEALLMAACGTGRASPNPLVGALVVRDGVVVGRGFHEHARRFHAEVIALDEAGERARGATLFVTLEPCSTAGRTPPCTEAILAAGIARVVACSADPNPRHAGAGLAILRRAGIEVACGTHREKALAMNAAFAKRITTGRPLVVLKAATSLDGRIAAGSGESRWITGEAARRRAHELRRASDAVLVGVSTVVADDPRLTARPGATPLRPLRVVLDPELRTPASARLFAPPEAGEGAGPVLVAAAADALAQAEGGGRARRLEDAGAIVTGLARVPGSRWLDLGGVLDWLAAEHGACSILVEGGGTTSGRFLAGGLADRVEIHVAPLLLGDGGPRGAFAGFGAGRLADGVRLRDVSCVPAPPDLLVSGDVEGGFDVRRLASELARVEGRA